VCEIGCGKGFLIDRILNKKIIDFLDEEERQAALARSKRSSPTKNTFPEDELNLPVLHFQNIERYVLCDQSQAHLDSITIPSPEQLTAIRGNSIKTIEKLPAFDEDGAKLPFDDNSLDCVVCGFYLHWVNDLPGLLSEIERVLKPDGAFVGALLGGNTLSELRTCFVLSEQEREGGVSAHVSPLSSIEDAGNILTRAGFNLPTIDAETIKVFYPDAFTLMHHLQCMGESNALFKRRPVISRETLVGAAAIYDNMYREKERGVMATFEVIHMIGWKKDSSQPK